MDSVLGSGPAAARHERRAETPVGGPSGRLRGLPRVRGRGGRSLEFLSGRGIGGPGRGFCFGQTVGDEEVSSTTVTLGGAGSWRLRLLTLQVPLTSQGLAIISVDVTAFPRGLQDRGRAVWSASVPLPRAYPLLGTQYFLPSEGTCHLASVKRADPQAGAAQSMH